MYIVRTNRYSRQNPPRTYEIDVHDLKIPGGDLKAHQLGGPDLFKECKRLRVPDIGPFMGHQELAVRLGTFIAENLEGAQ